MWGFTRSYDSPIYLSLVCKRPCPGLACTRGNGSLAHKPEARARGRPWDAGAHFVFFSNSAADGTRGLQTGCPHLSLNRAGGLYKRRVSCRWLVQANIATEGCKHHVACGIQALAPVCTTQVFGSYEWKSWPGRRASDSLPIALTGSVAESVVASSPRPRSAGSRV